MNPKEIEFADFSYLCRLGLYKACSKNCSEEICEEWKLLKTPTLADVCGNRRSSGWIPVSERLPEKAGIYLISFGDSVRESFYDVMRNKWDSGLSCEPFAWMPMLKPYEVGK